MLSADTNLFVYAYDAASPSHTGARRFLEHHQANLDFAICELVLIEIYTVLRRGRSFDKPMSAQEAFTCCDALYRNPAWHYIGYDNDMRADLWSRLTQSDFPARRTYDARLAFTLRRNGVTEFATANVKDFQGFGFARVWNPLEEDA